MMSPATILIDARFWQSRHGGLSKYSQGLIHHLARLDKKNHYLILTYSQVPQLSSNFRVITTGIDHYSIKEQTNLSRLIYKLKPDLVHYLHFNHPLMTPTPFVVTIHDLIKNHFNKPLDTTHNQPVFKLKRLAYHIVIRHALMASKRIITPSKTVKQDITKYYPELKSKIVTIYEGAFFNSTKTKPLSLTLPAKFLLYVGSLYQHKRVGFLIDNIGTIRNLGLDLIIVTPKRAPAKWLTRFYDHNITYLHGLSEPELMFLYQNCYALISASQMEGFGLPVIEALSFDKPVILSDIPIFREITKNDQLYFHLNQQSLQSRLKELILKYNQLKKKAQKIKSDYSFKTTAALTLNVYKTILNQSNRSIIR